MDRAKVRLAIVGAGPGGYVAAIRAAQRGAEVALIEKDRVGGVCLNRGCIPTKTLATSAELYSRMRRATEFGLVAGAVRPDMAGIIARKNAVVKRLVGGIQYLLAKNHVQLIQGEARFIGPRELAVARVEGELRLEAERIIIAAGTEPMVPSAFGHDGRTVMTSDEALDLEEIPPRLAIVGGGVIGCEFASIYAALGAEVTVVEMLPGLLPSLDPELGRALGGVFRKRGIKVLVGQSVEEIRRQADGVHLRLPSGEIAVDRVLVAIGRRTAADRLDLDRAGLRTDQRGRIPVGRGLETTVPGIYAIGDINDMPYDLAHAASHQALAVVESLYGPGQTYDDAAVPNCVFTDPEVASVGLTAEEATKRGMEIRTGRFPYLANGKALAMGESEGWVKIVAEAESGRILGVHIIGAHASDLAAEATVAVRNELTAEDLAETIHAHPTLAETMMEAALAVRGLAIHV
ncbi:MAG: dihydrolipoyl dehydrogenase [Patescibacteria group bacterium]